MPYYVFSAVIYLPNALDMDDREKAEKELLGSLEEGSIRKTFFSRVAIPEVEDFETVGGMQ